MRPTAVVLWLMILIVFVPIGAAHAIALFLEGTDHPEIASVDGGTDPKRVLTR